ncbi:MAG: tRNA pseudouridine(55) synthase TruB [Rikenellaceae bacterium]|nr:tRNA pseudouridine(55) synthase TruB [Rikenellaceae bacterium]
MYYHILDKESIKNKLSDNFDNYPHGIVIPLDKPYGWTSADAVRKIKFMVQRYFRLKNIKVGHAGTLDPLATGILLICIGKATKEAERLQSGKKGYIAEITLGSTTPSFDLEKEIDAYFPFQHINKDMIEEKLKGFLGEQDQIPPLFSAKLIDGKRAYEIARAGGNEEMKASRINIMELELISYQAPVLMLRVLCSKGTYIRSLARDFGLALESGAHLSGLTRISSGNFLIKNSVKIEEIEMILKQNQELSV